MNQSELIEKVAQTTELDQAAADQAVKAVVNAILGALSAGEPVRVAGFGIFDVAARPARQGRNPRTGETIAIAASKAVRFHAGKIPKHGEKRERELRELVRKQRRPIALIVDEAHDLHANTLKGLKRLMEVVANGGGTLSIILSGHPKLRNDLRQPRLEEVGYRMTIFDFEGIAGHQRQYIDWLLRACVAESAAADLIEEAAVELLAARLRTPLQIERHLTLAFEEAYRLGAKPVPVEIAEGVLSRQIDDLEPTLTRHGYDVRTLADQFNAKPVEIKAFLAGTLHADRTHELTELMKAAGIPV